MRPASFPASFPSGALSMVLLSAAVLGFEIGLMRMLLVASWHHFAFLVISIALLGFGASGTALTCLRPWLLRRSSHALLALTLLTAVAMPICTALAQHVPVESRFLPALLWRQIVHWLLYWALLTVPFLLGAMAIGLWLMTAGQHVGRMYAANLAGSGAGAVAATGLMALMPPAWLAALFGGVALLAALAQGRSSRPLRAVAVAASAAVMAIWCWINPPAIRPDPYKYAAHLQRLVDQGWAVRLERSYGARSMLELYRSDTFHDLPLLPLGRRPPAVDMLVVDGHAAGPVLRLAAVEDAEFVDGMMTALAYRLAPPRPRVLLLGETGGSGLWLAARLGASSIDLVQPDRRINRMLLRRPAEEGGAAFNLPGVRLITAEPRHYAEHAAERYDVVHLAALQSAAVGSGAVAGLGQDHLATVEGFMACLDRLTPEGSLVVARGIQTPPRDNLKLLATFIEALRRRGVTEPQRHLVIVRDFQWVCTIVRASPLAEQQIEIIRRFCHEAQFTPVWFPGIRPDELNQPDQLPAPPDGVGDWYYHAATRLFSQDASRFIQQWTFDIRPATDDRPFFQNFSRLSTIGAMRRAMGEMWLTRAELALLFVVAAMLAIGAAGALLTLAPLLFVRELRPRCGRLPTALYFAAIGLGYLMLEITLLSRITHLVGDPVLAAALVIAAFLIFSGAGAAVSPLVGARGGRAVGIAFAATIVAAAALLSFSGAIAHAGGAWSTPLRCLTAIAIVAPLALLMGMPMPLALARLDRNAPALLPWAWGINGFASVLAGPLATLIGMQWGFRFAGSAAVALYLLAALTFGRLPRPTQAPLSVLAEAAAPAAPARDRPSDRP